VHVPLTSSQAAEQQSASSAHEAPTHAHAGAQVPLVAPGATSHAPPQQSPLTVQEAPARTHGGAQYPAVQPAGTSQARPAQQSFVSLELCDSESRGG
jgi:hypothetical protein